jgi:hypothetical protein
VETSRQLVWRLKCQFPRGDGQAARAAQVAEEVCRGGGVEGGGAGVCCRLARQGFRDSEGQPGRISIGVAGGEGKLFERSVPWAIDPPGLGPGQVA